MRKNDRAHSYPARVPPRGGKNGAQENDVGAWDRKDAFADVGVAGSERVQPVFLPRKLLAPLHIIDVLRVLEGTVARICAPASA